MQLSNLLLHRILPLLLLLRLLRQCLYPLLQRLLPLFPSQSDVASSRRSSAAIAAAIADALLLLLLLLWLQPQPPCVAAAAAAEGLLGLWSVQQPVVPSLGVSPAGGAATNWGGTPRLLGGCWCCWCCCCRRASPSAAAEIRDCERRRVVASGL